MAIEQFRITAPAVSVEKYGSGHINRTFLAVCEDGKRYILQQINTKVFTDVDGLMNNITSVTDHIRNKTHDERSTLRVIRTLDGKNYYRDEEGAAWRVYDFVEGSLSLDAVEIEQDFYESAVGIGNFQKHLSDFPAETLVETIPRFHDTPNRVANLKKAIAEDKAGRKASVQREIDFALAREEDAAENMKKLQAGLLPLRVTHNDTKLNNVLMNAATRKAMCVIDLDTVMPGLAANDFGDSIRFGASTGAEDEKNLDKIEMSLRLYETYTEGFLSECGKSLTEEELISLPIGAKLMTYECGIRFLTDYLDGDVYFATHYEGQNLDRCHTQFKLVADMEKKMDRMHAIVEENK